MTSSIHTAIATVIVWFMHVHEAASSFLAVNRSLVTLLPAQSIHQFGPRPLPSSSNSSECTVPLRCDGVSVARVAPIHTSNRVMLYFLNKERWCHTADTAYCLSILHKVHRIPPLRLSAPENSWHGYSTILGFHLTADCQGAGNWSGPVTIVPSGCYVVFFLPAKSPCSLLVMI
ncbi:hypothetical protein EDD17DRAFT_1005863 [Pisolithus thermaeus]|nr:hypothetical protein EDD17DRAFT_1005863 [Pisolithus thermaeus]